MATIQYYSNNGCCPIGEPVAQMPFDLAREFAQEQSGNEPTFDGLNIAIYPAGNDKRLVVMLND